MIKKYGILCDEARIIREAVFIKEQGFKKEFDEIDKIAKHVVFYDNDNPIATCRYYASEHANEYIVGRVAIMKPYRGKKIGNYFLKMVEEMICSEGGNKIVLSAQVRVKDFYIKNGYITKGSTYYDEYCEHIHMEKTLT